MTTACPGDDFFEIVNGLNLEEPKEVVDFSKLSVTELLDIYTTVTQDLLGLGETINPTTDKGRELHSRRAAMSVELRLRGLL